MNSNFVTLNHLKHQVYTWGSPDKPLLFFIHGWMDTGASFDFVGSYLEKNFYCVAPDLRGFGLSDHSSNPLGYFFYEYLPDLHQLFEKFSPKLPVKIIGHSMGGNLASIYAGTFPDRVEALINLEGLGIRDMSPDQGPERLRDWINNLDPYAKRFRIYPDLNSIAQRLQKTNPRLESKRALFLAQHISQKVEDGFQIAADPKHKWINPYLFRLDQLQAFWKKITAKCLLIWGDETEMGRWMNPEKEDVQAEIQKRLACFPDSSKHVQMTNCGHMIHHEQPEELAKLILDFLD